MQEQITSKTALLTWEYSSAKTEADRWNAQVKLHGVWKSVVWMELQQPSKSPRPSEVAFGHGKGSDVMAPVPTDLCGACEHRAPPRAQPGCGMAVGGVQSASVGQTVCLCLRSWAMLYHRCRDCPLPAGLSLGNSCHCSLHVPQSVHTQTLGCSVHTQTLGCSAFPPVHTLGALIPSPGIHHCSAWHCLSKALTGKAPGKIWRKSQPANREGV